MASAERSQNKMYVREPLTPAKRKRLEKVFEHATKKVAVGTDFDYATDLFSQCVLGDPSNLDYLRAFLENLQKKYNNNRKGSALAMFQERGSRSALKKALAQEEWDEVIKHGIKVLGVNPWDIPTLTAMATAAAKTGDRECELMYLKCAATSNPKDPAVCRLYAIALGERNLYDLAMSWWHRVEELLPNNEEAPRAISVLTVQKARSRGDFDNDDATRMIRVREQQREDQTLEGRLRKKIEAEPKTLANYLELGELYVGDERYSEAEEVFATAFEVSDGDADIREKWEDAQLRNLRQQISKAENPTVKQKLQDKYFTKDVEVYQNRVERYPNNLAFKYELGYRYMLTKRYNDAIHELQAAKNDPRRKGVSMLVLGQCFQHIKQYRLAMSHYESAIQEIPDRDADNKKRALYRAGSLALGLRNFEVAEKHLSVLAGLDFSYKDVSKLLDKLAKLRENPESGDHPESGGGEPKGDQPRDEHPKDDEDKSSDEPPQDGESAS